MKEIEHIAEDLFNKLRSVYSTLQIGDASANKTLDPEQARFFDFIFEQNGKHVGSVTISLIEDQFKLYYSKDLTEDLGDDNYKKAHGVKYTPAESA